MAMITLNKASRLQASLRRRLNTLPLNPETTLSIFVADPAAEAGRRAAALRADIDRVDRLLTILADLRAVVGEANAKSGIAGLLAAKAGMEERIKLLSAVLLRPGAGKLRLFRPQVVFRDEETIAQQVAAMRLRYQAGEGAEDTLETALLDPAAHAALEARVAAAQRLLEDIGDVLRERNSITRVSVADDVLEWLRSEEVV